MTDYVILIFTLFENFKQQMSQESCKRGKQYAFSRQCFIVLFVMLQLRRVFKFKAQQRWLDEHLEIVTQFKSLFDLLTYVLGPEGENNLLPL